MSIDPKSLRLFVAVADHGSISEGAKRCHIALAAASKRISDLEARARLPLLVRHARGVTLTSSGNGLLLHARAVLSAMDRLDAELDDFQNGISGVVSITANASTIAQFLPPQIGSFLRQHPVLKIDLQERQHRCGQGRGRRPGRYRRDRAFRPPRAQCRSTARCCTATASASARADSDSARFPRAATQK